MKTHAEAKSHNPSRLPATPVPNALAHQAQLRQALHRAGVQPQLKIGAVNDPLEREADAVAERVLRMPEPIPPSPASGRGAGGEGKSNIIQSKASPAPTTTEVSPRLESNLNSLSSGGTSLDASTRAFFEPRFGQDFSQVRLHTDTNAAQMADSLNAKAFALGNDIAFGANQYLANTPAGKNLLGHELAHVVQQRGMGGGAPQAKRVQRQESEGKREKKMDPETAIKLILTGDNFELVAKANSSFSFIPDNEIDEGDLVKASEKYPELSEACKCILESVIGRVYIQDSKPVFLSFPLTRDNLSAFLRSWIAKRETEQRSTDASQVGQQQEYEPQCTPENMCTPDRLPAHVPQEKSVCAPVNMSTPDGQSAYVPQENMFSGTETPWDMRREYASVGIFYSGEARWNKEEQRWEIAGGNKPAPRKPFDPPKKLKNSVTKLYELYKRAHKEAWAGNSTIDEQKKLISHIYKEYYKSNIDDYYEKKNKENGISNSQKEVVIIIEILDYAQSETGNESLAGVQPSLEYGNYTIQVSKELIKSYSPEYIVLAIGHEMVHVKQRLNRIKDAHSRIQQIFAEIEAYKWMIDDGNVFYKHSTESEKSGVFLSLEDYLERARNYLQELPAEENDINQRILLNLKSNPWIKDWLSVTEDKITIDKIINKLEEEIKDNNKRKKKLNLSAWDG